MRRSKASLILLFLVAALGCKKEKADDPVTSALPGGKGGSFSVAIFSMHNGNGVAARIYMKYGANQKPSDTLQYDEKYNTMVEPGFGPHAHFENLKEGTYYISLQSGSLTGDTVLQLTNASPQSQDIEVALK